MHSEWPRKYSAAEVADIEKVLGHQLAPSVVEKLQEALEGFQWSTTADHFPEDSSPLFLSNHERRRQLKQLIGLCRLGAPIEQIEEIFNDLDMQTSRLLGPVDCSDLLALRQAAEQAISGIPDGMTPRRARRSFFSDLAPIFELATGRKPGRSVHDQEQGHFLAFAKTALAPFGSTIQQGSEADIKAVLAEMKLSK